MIGYVLLVWAWLYAATAIEAYAVQMSIKNAAPPPRRVCCNYIMKEGEKLSGGVHGEHGEEGLCREAG